MEKIKWFISVLLLNTIIPVAIYTDLALNPDNYKYAMSLTPKDGIAISLILFLAYTVFFVVYQKITKRENKLFTFFNIGWFAFLLVVFLVLKYMYVLV